MKGQWDSGKPVSKGRIRNPMNIFKQWHIVGLWSNYKPTAPTLFASCPASCALYSGVIPPLNQTSSKCERVWHGPSPIVCYMYKRKTMCGTHSVLSTYEKKYFNTIAIGCGNSFPTCGLNSDDTTCVIHIMGIIQCIMQNLQTHH